MDIYNKEANNNGASQENSSGGFLIISLYLFILIFMIMLVQFSQQDTSKELIERIFVSFRGENQKSSDFSVLTAEDQEKAKKRTLLRREIAEFLTDDNLVYDPYINDASAEDILTKTNELDLKFRIITANQIKYGISLDKIPQNSFIIYAFPMNQIMTGFDDQPTNKFLKIISDLRFLLKKDFASELKVSVLFELSSKMIGKNHFVNSLFAIGNPAFPKNLLVESSSSHVGNKLDSLYLIFKI